MANGANRGTKNLRRGQIDEIKKTVLRQHEFFATGKTLDIGYRKAALEALREAIRARRSEVIRALKEDLGKSESETVMAELGMVYEEIGFLLKNLHKFAKPHRVKSTLAQFPSKCFTIASPYGCTLIMSPWNYPFQLTLCPLADSIAAGNCALVKPSAYAPATASLLKKLIGETFPSEYIAVVTGGRAENTALLEQKYEMIFFTGGKQTGTLVAEKAARTLTPAVLELGGKSPCIVDADADLPLAARRIAFGKLLNAGQTCVAPDYLLVHEKIKGPFLELLKEEFVRQSGENALENEDYPHIVNAKHYERVKGLITPEKVIFGGDCDDNTRKIQPTILDNAAFCDPAMQEEIFGPVFPVLTFSDFANAKEIIAQNPTPLALYYFGKQNEGRALTEISFGGGCVNDTILHLATPYMGFGGVGESGMGAYHGERGFFAFSHVKSILKKGKFELSLRYAPYTEKKKRSLRRYLG